MSKEKQKEEKQFRSWYRKACALAMTSLGFHPEAVPVGGYWREWHRDGLTPKIAVQEFSLQLSAA